MLILPNFSLKVIPELERWGLRFEDNLVRVTGRVVDRERIMFGHNQQEQASDKADWNAAFRSKTFIQLSYAFHYPYRINHAEFFIRP